MTEVVCYLKSHFSMVFFFFFFFPHRRKEGHSEENTNKSEKSSRKTNATRTLRRTVNIPQRKPYGDESSALPRIASIVYAK